MLELHAEESQSIRGLPNVSVDREGEGLLTVRKHGVEVVSVLDRSSIDMAPLVTLDSGAWQTTDILKLMNATADELGLDFHVFQSGPEWRVDYGPVKCAYYYDGMSFFVELESRK